MTLSLTVTTVVLMLIGVVAFIVRFVAGLRELSTGDFGAFSGRVFAGLFVGLSMLGMAGVIQWANGRNNPFRCPRCKTPRTSSPRGIELPPEMKSPTWADIRTDVREVPMAKRGLAALIGLFAGGVVGVVLAVLVNGTDAIFMFFPAFSAVIGVVFSYLFWVVRVRVVRYKRLLIEMERGMLSRQQESDERRSINPAR